MRRAQATMALALSMVVSACGGGSPGADTGEPRSSIAANEGSGEGTQEELEAAATDAFTAFLIGADQIYFNFLANDCRETAGFGIVSEHLQSRRFNASLDGVDLAALQVTQVNVTDFTGSSATLALVIDGVGGDQFFETQPLPWIHEADGWKYVGCDEFHGEGGLGSGDEGSSRDNALGIGFIGRPADWFVVTTYVTPDLTDIVLETEGNAPPSSGNVYFGVQMSVQYDGPKTSSVLGEDLAFRLEAGGATYDETSSCGSYAQEPEYDYTAAPGDSMYFTFCWEVPTAEVDSAFIVVTELASGTDWWYATVE